MSHSIAQTVLEFTKVAQANLEFMGIPPPQSPNCKNYGCKPPHLAPLWNFFYMWLSDHLLEESSCTWTISTTCVTLASSSLKGTGSRLPVVLTVLICLSVFLNKPRTFVVWLTIEINQQDAAPTRCFKSCPLGFRCCFCMKSVPESVTAMELQSDFLLEHDKVSGNCNCRNYWIMK